MQALYTFLTFAFFNIALVAISIFVPTIGRWALFQKRFWCEYEYAHSSKEHRKSLGNFKRRSGLWTFLCVMWCFILVFALGFMLFNGPVLGFWIILTGFLTITAIVGVFYYIGCNLGTWIENGIDAYTEFLDERENKLKKESSDEDKAETQS